MTRLDDRLRGLDEVDVPDVWRMALDRGPQPPREHATSTRQRVGTIVLAFLIAASAFAFAVSRLSEGAIQRVGGEGSITRYRFDAPPQPIAVGEGAAWVHVGVGDRNGTPSFWRIDDATGEEQPIDVPGGEWPSAGGGSAWLLCNAAECGGHAVVQIDPASGSVIRTIDLPGRGGQIAGVQDGVWITTDVGVTFVGGDGRVARSFPGENYNLVGSDGTSIWVSRDGGLSKIDPETGEQLVRISSFPDVCTMEVADGTVWVASCDGGMHAGASTDELMGLDAVTGDVLFRVPLRADGQMRFLDGVLWLAERPQQDGPLNIIGLDPRTGVPTGASISIARSDARFQSMGPVAPAAFFAVGEHFLWVTDFGAGEVIRVSPPTPPSSAPSVAPGAARLFFTAPSDTGVLEVTTSPPSICYSTQSFPARPIHIQAQPPQSVGQVVGAYRPDGATYCDRSIRASLAADIIAEPSGYLIVWHPQAGEPITSTPLTPQG